MSTIKASDIKRGWTLNNLGYNAMIAETLDGEVHTVIFGNRELIATPYHGAHPDDLDSYPYDYAALAILRGYYK